MAIVTDYLVVFEDNILRDDGLYGLANDHLCKYDTMLVGLRNRGFVKYSHVTTI